MAIELLDEHEQSERVRSWLRQNGSAIVGGVLLGLVLILGYQWYQQSRAGHKLTAATQYQALADAVTRQDRDTLEQITQALTKDFSDTPYASMALLQLADQQFKAGENDKAVQSLEQAVKLAPDSALRGVAVLREARVKLAAGDAEAALALAGGEDAKVYAGLAAELRGDALVTLGRTEDARAAYAEALTALDAATPNHRIVEMKVAELATAASAATTADDQTGA